MASQDVKAENLLEEWEHGSLDQEFVPSIGDSSAGAAGASKTSSKAEVKPGKTVH